MTDVIAGQTLALLGQFYDFAGGNLTDLDATPTIAVTSVATGATALAATTTGVTHPGTGSYGYAWTPASTLTPGSYLALWAGTKSGGAVTATETITVYAPASAANTNTSPDGIWYATREDVKNALDVKGTARNNQQIARALEDASRDAEKLCHRRFYPVQATRYFDWPPRAGMTPWILRLNDQELISVSSIASGGRTLTPDEYNLEPVNSGPPFNRVEIKLSSDGSFGGGSTYQRDIQIAGLWNYRLTETNIGALAEALDDTETAVDVTGPVSAAIGVGSIVRVDSERMLVTERSQLDTGQNLGAPGLDAQAKTVTVPVTDGTVYAVEEVILIDAERMRIDDIAGNQLIVKRGWDGTVLAAHTAGADIYAPRRLTVTRGALGTMAAAHADTSTVYRFEPAAPVKQFVIADSISTLTSETAGYVRTSRSGSSGSEQKLDTSALAARREATYNACGRKGRVRAV